jgi:hypothetical protein
MAFLFVENLISTIRRDQPYSAIIDAFRGICWAIKNIYGGEGEKEANSLMSKVGEAIVSELGSEVQLLEQLIPELPSILPFARRKSQLKTSIMKLGRNGRGMLFVY